MAAPRFARAVVARSTSDSPGCTVGALFAASVARRRDAEIVVDGARRLSFGGLRRLVDRFADAMRARGVGRGDVVAYQLPNWWEAVAIFLATAEVGAIANPLLPSFRERELAFTLRQSCARLLFAPDEWRGCSHAALIASLRPALPDLRDVILCRTGPEAGLAPPDPALPNAAPSPSPDDLLLLMYTSGTTALPKGVLHTHDTLAAEILSLARVHEIGPGDRCLVPSPVTHISGVIHAILTPAILGTAAVLMDRWDAGEALRLIERERVTYMAGAPTFLQDLATHPDAPHRDLASLRLFSCGGAAVSADLVRQARARLPTCVAKRVYGSTEFPTISTTGPDDAAVHGIDSEGRAIAPAEVRIVRDDETVAPTGEEGEVQARGPECFVGYADAAMNDEAFTADGWFRTGDLGTLDARGYLRITGRLKEIVVRKAEKISARELEEVLARHPAIAEVAVVPVPDRVTGERACAVVVLRPGQALTLAELGAFLDACGLARPKHPEELVALAALPRTESGKIAKSEIRATLAARSGGAA